MLCKVECGTRISLQDETGVFSEVDPPEPGDLSHTSSSEGEGEGTHKSEAEIVKGLRAEVDQLKKEWRHRKSEYGSYGG